MIAWVNKRHDFLKQEISDGSGRRRNVSAQIAKVEQNAARPGQPSNKIATRNCEVSLPSHSIRTRLTLSHSSGLGILPICESFGRLIDNPAYYCSMSNDIEQQVRCAADLAPAVL